MQMVNIHRSLFVPQLRDVLISAAGESSGRMTLFKGGDVYSALWKLFVYNLGGYK